MFNFRRKHQRHHGPCHGKHAEVVSEPIIAPSGSISLTEAQVGKRLIVHSNSDLKTLEMGLYTGSIITLLHNETNERNVIVKIQDHRYVIPREIAERIFVKK